MRVRVLIFLPVLMVALAACTQFPELDDSVSPEVRQADFPPLVPLAPLLAANTSEPTRGADIAASLQSRVAGLNARASRLRGSILSPAERARLREQPGT